MNALNPKPDGKLRGSIRGQALSPREMQIVELIAQGKMNKEIMLELHIAKLTLNQHIARIKEKTGYRNKVQIAVRYDYLSNWGMGI